MVEESLVIGRLLDQTRMHDTAVFVQFLIDPVTIRIDSKIAEVTE